MNNSVLQGEHLELVRLRPELRDAYLAMVDEFEATGEGYPYNNIPLAREDFAAYVRELEDEEQGIGVPPGISRQTTYVLVRDGNTVVGEIRFRPVMMPGRDNIGYNVRPSARRRGYASFMLGQVLTTARGLGLTEVLFSVGGENFASQRLIAKHGGIRAQQSIDPSSGTLVLTYSISLSSQPT
jgi:predicted acetyltransferase